MIIDSRKYNGKCSCGRNHAMETEMCIVESGCLENLEKYMREYNLTGFTVAVYDENTYKATDGKHPKVHCEVILPPEKLHANEHGVDLLAEKLPQNTEVLIAIGSGTVHDLVRYCAYERKIDFVSCPTAASVDGFCSSVAAMTWHGCKKTLTAVAPKIVVADIDVIKNAPIRLSKSGFGDMIGKYVALTDWKISNILTGEFYCDRIANMTYEATQKIENSIDGILSAHPSAYENLMYGLLMSGLAMQMFENSRPASGAEHHISHIIEMSPKGLGVCSDALHGEKVGVGTLIAIEEYRRMASLDNVSFCDYTKFDEKTIMEIFGNEQASEIVKENMKDAAEKVTAELLKTHWDEILVQIQKMPDIIKLRETYLKYGIKAFLCDIGVDDSKKTELMDCSPMVRNRLTLMRLRKCLKEA